MSPHYRRKKPGPRETGGAALAALGVATGAAVVTFYFVRLMLSREPLRGSDGFELATNPGRALPGSADGPSRDAEDQG